MSIVKERKFFWLCALCKKGGLWRDNMPSQYDDDEWRKCFDDEGKNWLIDSGLYSDE